MRTRMFVWIVRRSFIVWVELAIDMANSAPLAGPERSTWPGWAKGLASLAVLWQVGSLLMAELASPPASPLEEAIARPFRPYYELTDQGHDHRFYSDIGPTPILLAELRFADGRPSRTIRIPDRGVRPRIVYQRQLALAHWARLDERWAQSIARHLCWREQGCSGVTIRLQLHDNPTPGQLIEAAGRRKPIDPDSEEFYAVPILLGDFPCPTP